MKFERSDIKSIEFYDYATRDKTPCEITDHLEFKFNTEAKISVELLKQIDSQRLNCALMHAGIIDVTLSFNCIARAELNDLFEDSFSLSEADLYRLDSYLLPYTIECKSPLVTKVGYDDGQPELESDELLLDFAEVFNEVPSLYSELISTQRSAFVITFK